MNIELLGTCELKFYKQLSHLKFLIKKTGYNYFKKLDFIENKDIIIDNLIILSAYSHSSSFVKIYFEIFRNYDILYYAAMFDVSQNGDIIYQSLIYQKITSDEFKSRRKEFYENK